MSQSSPGPKAGLRSFEIASRDSPSDRSPKDNVSLLRSDLVHRRSPVAAHRSRHGAVARNSLPDTNADSGQGSRGRNVAWNIDRRRKMRPWWWWWSVNQSDDRPDDPHVPYAASDATATMDMDTETPAMKWHRIRQQFGLFWRLARPYFMESVASRGLLARVVGVTLVTSALTLLFSYVMKDFWNALGAKDEREFYRVVVRFVLVMVVAAPVFTLSTYYMEQLAIHWCEWMTTRTFARYGTNQVYYKLEQLPSTDDNGEPVKIDNPDQRITEDVHLYTSLSITLVTKLVQSVIDLISFSVILWSIAPSLYFSAVAYAAIGTTVTLLLGQTLIRLQFQQARRDADLRYSLVRLRDNAESIAFYRGADASEGHLIQWRIVRAMNNRRYVNVALRNLGFFTQTYWFLTEVLPIVIVAPRYFAGEIEMGVLNQGVGAFTRVLINLSIVIDSFKELSTFSAGIERLVSFYEAMSNVDGDNDTPFSHRSLFNVVERTAPSTQRGVLDPENSLLGTINFPPLPSLDTAADHTSSPDLEETMNLRADSQSEIDLQQWNTASVSPILQIQKLVLVTPDRKRILISDLNVKLEAGQHLLITGSSGAGKSSLLRAIAGLWTAGTGIIGRPADDYVYFLPQRPYCTIGSLKDQLLYPCSDFSDGDSLDASSRRNGLMGNRSSASSHKSLIETAELLEILEQIDLLDVAIRAGDGDPARGLTIVMDWTNTLSLGEQQRLAFGRLLVNQPFVVLLDEATSALDLASEARMYRLLQQMSMRDDQRRVTYISVGHRPSLLAFHERKLRLGGPSDHELCTIDKSAQITPTAHAF